MGRSIKRITFAKNGFGFKWMTVNTMRWEIVQGCSASQHLVGRACRLADRGNTLEYRTAEGYQRINAAIEKMS